MSAEKIRAFRAIEAVVKHLSTLQCHYSEMEPDDGGFIDPTEARKARREWCASLAGDHSLERWAERITDVRAAAGPAGIPFVDLEARLTAVLDIAGPLFEPRKPTHDRTLIDRLQRELDALMALRDYHCLDATRSANVSENDLATQAEITNETQIEDMESYKPWDREPRTFGELCTWIIAWHSFNSSKSDNPRIPVRAHDPDHHYLELFCKDEFGAFDLEAAGKLRARYARATRRTVEQIDNTTLRELADHFHAENRPLQPAGANVRVEQPSADGQLRSGQSVLDNPAHCPGCRAEVPAWAYELESGQYACELCGAWELDTGVINLPVGSGRKTIHVHDAPRWRQLSAGRPKPPVDPPTIWYHGERSYSADGSNPVKHSQEEHNFLTPFLDREIALDTAALTDAGVSNVSKVAKALEKKYPGAVRRPTAKGTGYFCRVRSKTATS